MLPINILVCEKTSDTISHLHEDRLLYCFITAIIDLQLPILVWQYEWMTLTFGKLVDIYWTNWYTCGST